MFQMCSVRLMVWSKVLKYFSLSLSDAPQVSPYSSCNSARKLIMCSCEAYGNPSPKLVWHLSGQTVLPSESTPIREESVGDTGLKSFITVPQSFVDTPTLQCIGINKLGVDTHLFNTIKSGRQSKKRGRNNYIRLNVQYKPIELNLNLICFLAECRHSAVPYLILSLSMVLLLCAGIISFLICKLKQ